MKQFLSKINSVIASHKNLIISFLLGLSLVFSYAPFSLWWLPFIVFPLWFKQLQNLTSKQAFKQGYCFALGWFASGISWVHVAIDEFGGLPLVASLLLMLLLCAYLALYPALACYLSAKLSKNSKVSLWLVPPLWMLCEYLRGTLLTGFPWLSLGYSQIDGPLSVYAPVIGETGINFVLLIIAVSIFSIINKAQPKVHLAIIGAFSLVTVSLHHINWYDETDKTIKVALVQGNIEQSLKWDPEQEWPSMLKYLDLSRDNFDADIIVWPESAVTALEPTAQDFLDMVDRSANLNNTAIITGILNYKFNAGHADYYNSLIVTGNKTDEADSGNYSHDHSNRYSKYHLLPIGEFVPFQDLLRPIAPLFNLPQSSFSRGDYVQPNLIAKDINILPLICFEIAFPDQLVANFTDLTDVLLTVSNDAWFGASHGPHQHLEIARMRAMEFARPLLRSTNTGITAVIDHTGKVVGQIPQFQEAVLKTDIMLVKGKTPYQSILSLINGFLVLYLLLVIFIISRSKRPSLPVS